MRAELAPPSKTRCVLNVIAAATTLALVSGCAAPLERPTISHASREIEGRIAVHYEGSSPTASPQALSGHFEWVESPAGIDITLTDPLGQAVAIVHRDDTQASLVLRDGHRFNGASAEALCQQALGFPLPVSGLRYWIDGRRSDGGAFASTSAPAYTDQGWTIRYPQTPVSDAPARLDLNFAGPDMHIDIRLMVDSRQ